MLMRFSEIIEKLPDDSLVKKRIKSEEFQLSQTILGMRVKSGLTRTQAGKLCKLTEKEYKSFEDALIIGHINEYKSVADILKRQLGK